jgi:hypothetical protein
VPALTSTRILAFAVLLLLGAVPVDVGAQPAGVTYDLVLYCGGNIPLGPATPVSSGGGCPIRAIDGDDLMGDPSLAVDPLQPENLIMGSLHGCAQGATCALAGPCAEETPSPRARCGQVFTTFTSQNQGINWLDSPFVPPDDIGSDAFGIHPQVTIDPYGQVYVGSLYAIPSGNDETGTPTYEFVIGAQKFESIDTIGEEQTSSQGSYNAEYITPVHEHNQINQMWFTFNPITDNMTMVWHESVFAPPVPPCDTDSAYLVDAAGNYVKVDALTQQVTVYSESNGIPDLQSAATCPNNPDDEVVATPPPAAAARAPAQPAPLQAAPAPNSAILGQASAPVPSAPASVTTTPLASGPISSAGLAPGPVRQSVNAPSPVAALTAAAPPAHPQAAPALAAPVPLGMQPNQTNSTTTNSTAPHNGTSPPPSSSSSSTSDASEGSDEEVPARGTIGVVWTSSDSDTPYYYQDVEDAIAPCSGSTNPVLSFGWLYIGCIVDTSEGEFRWAPEVANGTVQLFRLHPDGGKPEYMGQAPDMVGPPKLGVRSDGRLALVAGGASEEGALKFSAAFGRYEPTEGRIEWTKQLSLGHDIRPLDPLVPVVRANIQDMVYREQSGALHVILKTTVNINGGPDDVLESLGLAPHIQKTIIALDEDYGLLATLPLDIGDPQQRNSDATIASAPEAAFQDLSDDFLLLPAEPYSYNGVDLGELYQREFFAIADYGTVLFAEVVELTTLRATPVGVPPPPPAPVAAPATTNLVAPVVGLTGASALLGTLVAHRRKNPLAAFTKGE